jgi:extracellular factor (EF) 3-hydroxypalmitic acid methyl ester biosynthesis protein
LLHSSHINSVTPYLDLAVADVVRRGLDRYTNADEGRHRAATLSHRLILGIADEVRAGRTRDHIASRVRPAWDVHAQSPFIRRLQLWPRGYPGDFETVEYILEQRNRAAPETLAYYLEQHALDSPIAQQHRNKVALQARAILDAVADAEDADRPARILVLAAGSGADVAMVQRELVGRDVQLVLLDQDRDALDFAMNRLTRVRAQVTPVCRNVIRGLGTVRQHGPFDLVLAGGLFDYLSDNVAVGVMRQAHERLLAPGGRFFFTNIGVDNPYRLWIEYLGDWRLIHRSADDVRALCAAAGFSTQQVEVTTERTGLALIVTCAKPGAPRLADHVPTVGADLAAPPAAVGA